MCNINVPKHFRATPIQRHRAFARSGITLLEVLIALGVLAIGLSALVAAIPAANAIAKQAIITDTATLVAANALAHAITSGLSRVDSLNESHRRFEREGGEFIDLHKRYYKDPIDGFARNRMWHTYFISDLQSAVGIDAALRPGTDVLYSVAPSGGHVIPKAAGLFSQIGDNRPIDHRAWRLLTTGHDDLRYLQSGQSDDSPLRDHVIDGARFSLGRYTVIYALSGIPAIDINGFSYQGFPGHYIGHAFSAGCTVSLTSIVFYNRPLEAEQQIYEGYVDSRSVASEANNPAALPFMVKFRRDKFMILPEGQTVRDVLAPGTVVYFPRAEGVHRFAQIVAMFPMIYDSGGPADTYQVTVTGGARHMVSKATLSGPVFLLTGSVALAQQLVTLEGDGSLYPVPRADVP